MKHKLMYTKGVNILLALVLAFSFVFSYAPFGIAAGGTNDITLSFDWFKTSGLALIPNVNLSSLYGVSGSKDFTGTITVDGTEKTVVYTVSGINLVLWGVKTTNASSTIEIKAGTVLTCAGVDPIRITKTFRLKKTDGSWTVEENKNEITLDLDWFTASGLALTPGTNLSIIYNVPSGGSKDFNGPVTIDGTETNAVYSITGVNLVLWGVKTTNASATVEIKAGTVLTCTNADSILITKAFKLKKTDGVWAVAGEEAEQSNETTLDFDWFTAGGLALIPSINLSVIYNLPSGASKDFTGLITIDGTETTAVYTVTGVNLVLWGVKTSNASSTVEIKAGTVLTCVGADSILITKAFKLKKTDGSWAVEDNTNKITLSFDWFTAGGLALIPDTNLSSVYNLPSGGSKDFTGSVTVDGTEKTAVYSVTGINLVLWGVKTTNASSTVEIKAGTVLTCDGANPILITKELSLKKTDGIWAVSGEEAEQSNETTLAFDWFSASGLALIPGTNLSSVYNLPSGGSKDFTGPVTIDGTEINAVYSVTGMNLVLWRVKTTNASSTVEIKAGTILTAKGSKSIKITEDFKLVYDSSAKAWSVPGKADNQEIPEVCNDINISFNMINGKHLQLNAVFADGRSSSLKDVYGDWVTAYGKIQLEDSENGVYTEKNAAYSITSSFLILYGIEPGLKDSIEITKGTILWPDKGCQSQVPLRIMNTLRLERDNNDDWIVVSNGSEGESGTNTNNPATGEETHAAVLLSLLLLSAVFILGNVVLKKGTGKND